MQAHNVATQVYGAIAPPPLNLAVDGLWLAEISLSAHSAKDPLIVGRLWVFYTQTAP